MTRCYLPRAWSNRPDNPAGKVLTPTQYAVAESISKGSSCAQTAVILGLAVGTVKLYLSRDIYPRLEVYARISNQGELMRWWIDNIEERRDCKSCLLRTVHDIVKVG